MIRRNETNMQHRTRRAVRRLALGLGFLAMVGAARCSGDDNGTTGTASGGSGGAGGSGGTGGGGSGTQDAGDQDGFVICPQQGDPVDSYHANLVKAGSDGKLTFTLVQSDNAPPIRGYNVWQLKITKADMSAVTGEITPKVEMPRHIHPAGLQPDITYDAALGLYRATPIHFFMPGYWAAQFTAYEAGADAGTPLDRGTFYFCVE